jgi:hypothetical protein
MADLIHNYVNMIENNLLNTKLLVNFALNTKLLANFARRLVIPSRFICCDRTLCHSCIYYTTGCVHCTYSAPTSTVTKKNSLALSQQANYTD